MMIKTYSSIEEVEARLKEVQTLKKIMEDALEVEERDLKLYEKVFKPQAGDDKIIAEIKANIERITENLMPLISEEMDLKHQYRTLKKKANAEPAEYGA